MAYIILPHRWGRQPTYPVGVDWSNPLSKNLIVAYSGGAGHVFNAANNQISPFGTGAPGKTITRLGVAATQQSNTLYNSSTFAGVRSVAIVTAFTGTALESTRFGYTAMCFLGDGGFAGVIAGYPSGTYPNVRAQVFWKNYQGSNTVDGPASVAGQSIISATTIRTNRIAFAANGVFYGESTATGKDVLTATLVRISDNNYQGLAGSIAGYWFFGSAEAGVDLLSDGALVELSKNPWQLFRPIQRRIYVPSAGGGAITGTSALVFGAGSSTVTGKGALAGSAALAFGAGSSTATGKGAVAGSAALTFAAGSSTLAGKGTVAGSAALTFAASGTVAGKGAVAGSAALAFAASGAIVGKGALAATSALTFTVEGALLNAAAGSVAGTSAITFAPTGTLTGKGSLAATGAMAFAGSGAATGKGALTGQADVLFTLAGALDGVAGGSVAGTAAFAFTPTGTLTGKGAIAGTAAMIFVPTARARAIGIEVYASSGASTQRTKAGRRAQVSGRARAAQTAARRRIN